MRAHLLCLALLLTACSPAARTDAVQLPPGPGAQVGADFIRLLPCGEPAFAAIRGLILDAHSSVQLEMYEFGRRDLADALIADRKRGLSVTWITDPTESASARTTPRLRDAGITVFEYPVRKMAIDHVKLLIVDGTTAVVGGINWGSGSSHNHDFDIEAQGPLVGTLEAVYRRDLLEVGQPVNPDPLAGDSAAAVGTTLPDASIRPLVAGLISSAQRQLDVAMYTFTDSSTVNLLIDAHNRGIEIRVLLDPGQRVNDPAAASLRNAGIQVRLFAARGNLLHAKCAVADGHAVIVGSANWTLGGFERNHEVDVELQDAPAIAGQMEAQFGLDWNASA